MLPSFKLLPFELHFPFASSACVRDEKVSQHHPAWSSCNTHFSPVTAGLYEQADSGLFYM